MLRLHAVRTRFRIGPAPWLALLALVTLAPLAASQPCTAPDNGMGTILFPAACPYEDPEAAMLIIDGLPPGATIELHGPLTEFTNVVNVPGGTLGGEICTFDAFFLWEAIGTGPLTGFQRTLSMPVSGEIHIGLRNPGDPLQTFSAMLRRLQGTLYGDPDFCELSIAAGEETGMPGPGEATLARLPNGDFAVDSFFDITYRIDFAGCPGSMLAGMAGSTSHTVHPRTAVFQLDWCRLDRPLTIVASPGTPVAVFGRVYIAGLTNLSVHNDPLPGLVVAQVGYGADGSDPSAGGWFWFDAAPNPDWNGAVAGEPDNDEYGAELVPPPQLGTYDFAYRFSVDAGATWTYGDRDTGVPGEDGSENGYQPANAGELTVIPAACCVAEDNGTGTIDFPPDCPYANPDQPMRIIAGLPPGTTLELTGPLQDFFNVVNAPGGTLGGEICTFDAVLPWDVTGTGELVGFNRVIWMPVSGEIHIAPRTPGDPIQSFAAELYRLDGELFGDPDFCALRIEAGQHHGLPASPGHAVLTELPSGDYAVDSFFDITYRIDFEGCPDSQLADYAGTTTDTVTRRTCETYPIDWCRLQGPLEAERYPGESVTIYGRLYVEDVTDRSVFNDPIPGFILGQVGCGPGGSDPSTSDWSWFAAVPTPGWDGSVCGEPDNDEYVAELVAPAEPGTYDYAYRFSGDGGASWLYGDRDTGLPGEDGSENGYQPDNAGVLTVPEPLCCIAPDNGTGTVDFPPPGCAYAGEDDPMLIIAGLPPATTIELHGPLGQFFNVVNVAGGSLGGESCTFEGVFEWDVIGTGELAGFHRTIWMPIAGEIHIRPRTPGDPVQTFEAEIYALQGQLFGDPDFCEMIVRAGVDLGLPSPGQTTLTKLPSGNYMVDSFFDITYQIQFEGCPDSQLADYAGTTTETVRRSTCTGAAGISAGDRSGRPQRLRLHAARPNPFVATTRLVYFIPEGRALPTSLAVYDAAGRCVRSLVAGAIPPGIHETAWDGRDAAGHPVAGGIYFVRLHASPQAAVQRIVRLR